MDRCSANSVGTGTALEQVVSASLTPKEASLESCMSAFSAPGSKGRFIAVFLKIMSLNSYVCFIAT